MVFGPALIGSDNVIFVKYLVRLKEHGKVDVASQRRYNCLFHDSHCMESYFRYKLYELRHYYAFFHCVQR